MDPKLKAERRDVISVTMSLEAAERFRRALGYAEARIYPYGTSSPPLIQNEAGEHADWLRWGSARVALAVQRKRAPDG